MKNSTKFVFCSIIFFITSLITKSELRSECMFICAVICAVGCVIAMEIEKFRGMEKCKKEES